MEKVLYDGFYKIVEVEAELKGKKVMREKLIQKSAVAALVIDSDFRVGLVKQFRPAIGEYTYEIPAGVLDKPGLTPKEVLLEELQEECEISPEQILYVLEEPAFHYKMTPGSSDAEMTIYSIRVTKQENKQVQDEDVEEVVWLEPEQLAEMIEKNEIKDPKTLIAVQHYLWTWCS